MTHWSSLPGFSTPARGRHVSRRSGRALAISIAALALLGGGAYAFYTYGIGGPSVTAQPLTIEAVRGPFDHIVLEQGEIESSSNIDVLCEVKARGGSGTPIIWVIDEGTYVKKGDKLVELDSSALEQEMKTQRIVVSSAEAQVISSRATVQTAVIALREYLEGTYQSERKAILSEIALAEQELRKAELNLESARRLAAKGMLKGLQIEAEQFAVANAKNVLESAQARLKVLDELTREKNKVQFESDIEAAKAKLESDESVLAEEEDKLAEIQDQMAKCTILSPAEGVVVHNNVFSGRGGSEFVVEEGAMIRERQCIIKLPDPSKMQVKAKINESRITLVAAGMAAKIKVGAVEGEMLARVKRVNKYAEPGSWFSSAVKEYATFIEIMSPPEAIRTGMTAEVRIFVAQLDDVLQVPVHAVYEFKGRHFCMVSSGENKWDTREIKIGATNEKMVTVDEGLEEGDTVALNPRNFLNLMDLPEIDDVSDREALAEIGANAEKPAPLPAEEDGPSGGPAGRGGPGGGGQGGRGPGGPGGGGPGAGGPGGGGPGGGGPGGGGFDPAAIVERIFSASDTDGDGKLSTEEISAMDGRMKDNASSFDSNGDGSIDKQEMIKGMRNFRGGGGGGPPR